MPKSTDSLSDRKPQKPHPDFPLGPRKDGRWQKRIHGKLYCFSGTAEEALAEYDKLLERLGGQQDERYLLRDLCNLFMDSKDVDLAAGHITDRTHKDYDATCKLVLSALGRLLPLDDLNIGHAEIVREKLTRGVGVKTQSNRINRARCVFKFGVDRLILDKPFHLWLKTVPRSKLRKYRNQQPSREMSPPEIRAMIDAADLQLRAMIMLGINCGFSNSDCSDLTIENLDLHNGWHDETREKTGIKRRAKLWPETVVAIREALAVRPKPRNPEHDDRLFLTKRGGLWVKEDRKTNPLSTRFRELAKSVGCYRPGVSFYTLRHCFETIGGNSKDQVAVNYAMGHCDESMAAHYRSGIADERLQAVSDEIHRWVYSGDDAGPRLRVVG